MKRKRGDSLCAPGWNTITDDICLVICSFCDLNDLISLRRTSSLLRRCARHQAVIRHVLHFSAIAWNSSVENKDYACGVSRESGIRIDYDENRISHWIKKEKQQECIWTILNEIMTLPNQNGTAANIRPVGFLQHLDMSNLQQCKAIPQVGLPILESLLVLDLTNCGRLDPQCLIDLTAKSGSQSNYISPPLKELYLTGCNRIGESCVNVLVQYFVNIRTLHLGLISQSVSDVCISHISRHLKELESLDITGLNKVTGIGIADVFRQLDKLKYLNVNGCGRMKWTFLSNHCALLELWMEGRPAEEILDLFNMARYGHISELREILSMSRIDIDIFSINLEVAKISFGPNIRGGIPRNSLSLLAISSLGRLREVDVSGASNVSDDDVRNLIYTCRDSLRSLEMRCCENLGNSSLVSISQLAKKLTLLDISACFAVSDSGVKSLSESTSLTTLKISSLSQVTNEGVCSLSNLEKLMVLDIQNCAKVGSTAVRTILQNCQNLIELDARNIRDKNVNLTREEKERLVVFNGRLCNTKYRVGSGCSARCCSQRNIPSQGGVKARRMYHCRQCKLLQSNDRGICISCATTCHKGHDGVYCSSITYFYCDCAFGFQDNTCLFNSNQP